MYPGTPGHDRDGRALRRGDIVRCERPEGRPLGSWPRYEGRLAVVLVPDNRSPSERAAGLRGEVGVSWDLTAATRTPAGPVDSWFVAAEVVFVRGPEGRVRRSRRESIAERDASEPGWRKGRDHQAG
jgi:hypothetical protein